MVNFDEIKTIKVVEVLGERYKIRLRYRGDYASGLCPLPTHKPNDKDRSFAVHIPSNTWRCFSKSCGNERPADVITLVKVMEGCRPYEAAQKLEEWYKKPAPTNGNRNVQGAQSNPLPNTPVKAQVSDSGKGFMASLRPWWDEVVSFEPDAMKKAVFDKIFESYKNGKTAKT